MNDAREASATDVVGVSMTYVGKEYPNLNELAKQSGYNIGPTWWLPHPNFVFFLFLRQLSWNWQQIQDS